MLFKKEYACTCTYSLMPQTPSSSFFGFLGLTNFDLIGNFGSMDWLGNFYIIMLCNVVFAGLTTLCLVTKFTKAVRTEIYDRLMAFFIREQPAPGHTHSSVANGDVSSKED